MNSRRWIKNDGEPTSLIEAVLMYLYRFWPSNKGASLVSLCHKMDIAGEYDYYQVVSEVLRDLMLFNYVEFTPQGLYKITENGLQHAAEVAQEHGVKKYTFWSNFGF
jgi:Mn-dependent DtxR family transcriptional regulator